LEVNIKGSTSDEREGKMTRMCVPGKMPCWPLSLPVHQSSALAVRCTISILSPVLKLKSPSACASKSYSATTYEAAGFGFEAGIGGGGRFVLAVAAAAPNALAPIAPGVYGGGAAAAAGGGGGGAFLRGVVDLVVDALEVERPRPDVPPALRVLPLVPVVCLVERILAVTSS
jgi:hypothetical protein